jgi:hypothetical protein
MHFQKSEDTGRMWPFCANRLLKRALKQMMVSPRGLQSVSKHVYKFCNTSDFSSSLSTSFTASQFDKKKKRRNYVLLHFPETCSATS